jgi:hypothetical protein
MRLDFNVIVVDDDWDDEDSNGGIKALVQALETTIKSKGFSPKVFGFSSVADAGKANIRRADLYLSDNNLGDNATHLNPNEANGGIEYYLQLKNKYICDFVLYTRSQVAEIVAKLASDLTTKKDPNLFSRFTFVSRDDGSTQWHRSIIDLIDHLLTKREELNNLRGLYAQQTSKIDEHLKRKYPSTATERLKKTINSIPVADIDAQKRQELHEVREIRNGLMHYDEELCSTNDEFVVRFQDDDKTKTYEIFESNIKIYRDKLNAAYDFVEQLTV